MNPTLADFYERVYALENGAQDRVLSILHLGDSHIAGDRFSGSLQSRFANRLGGAGRGQLPPGKPFPYYRRQGISVQSSEGWTMFSSLYGKNVGPFGLSGFRAESASASDWMSMRMTGAAALYDVNLDLLQQPNGGGVEILLNGVSAGVFRTNGPVPSLMQVKLEAAQTSQIMIRPVGDGPVAVLGWGGVGAGPGVLYEAQGIPGATLRVMDVWDETIVSAQLAAMAPDLILLGYGTNEGFDDALDLQLYEKMLERRLAWLHDQLPTTTLVVLGAFDGARLPTWRDRTLGGQDVSATALPCSPLALNERAMYGSLSADRDPVLSRWHGPPNLDKVRAIQQKLARKFGATYWDGAASMGGACSIHQFIFADPPKAYGDHVHLTPNGADYMAARLWDYLMKPYASLVCRLQLVL